MRPYKLDRTNDLLTSHACLLATAQLRLCKKSNIVVPAKETVQKTNICRSCEGDCAKNLVRLRWWKTQPPKSPLSGGLSKGSPPDKGDLGGWVFRQRDLARVSCTVSQAGWKPSANPCCLMGGTGEGQ